MRPAHPQVTKAINSALGFLERAQLPEGEYATYIADDPHYQTNVRLDRAVFATTFVLYSLTMSRRPGIEAMMAKALTFLESEMLEGGVWAYWAAKNPRMLQPDLDDTACVSFALRQGGRRVPDNIEVFRENRDPNGLFYTWIRRDVAQPRADRRQRWVLSEAAQTEICGVVNANAALYLGESNGLAAEAIEFLKLVVTNGLTTRGNIYYLTPEALPYMVSRAFVESVPTLGTVGRCLTEQTRERSEDGWWGDPLSTALALNTLMNFGASGDDIDTGVARLCAAQNHDGAWAKIPFYTGPHCGSEELTTAFALEALAKWERRIRERSCP